ncbi:hypothetical protein AXK12_07430 [Cephaloticoccus capnophilus]|uniref:Phytanoyl-CoA dioxygenase n=1 Tax=Cephaloticoccus capnophilus TaxID=1548208 RepID=A0A139SIE8_9BACT|nr:phytanoyl-CoA dioxygenase family protein [Cephaloticoccus capnophilus]KXU34301.1 hypothetical protein AXK12_07430 [Cephaloticoccus capnophilus]
MNTAPAPVFDDHEVDFHSPELYQPVGIGHGVERLEDVGPDEVDFFHREGYLVVRHAFDSDTVARAKAELIDLIMGKMPDFKGISFEAKARGILPMLSVDQRQDAVRKLQNFVNYAPVLHALAFHPALVRVMRQVLGGAAPKLIQDMALIKPPHIGREKPWHQDNAYFNYPVNALVVGVWIALDDATIENGCMRFLPGQHRDGPKVHFMRRDWQLCDTDTLGQRPLAAPLEPGGLLLFNGLLPHGTPHNSSGQRRRALQYHYTAEEIQPLPDDSERLKNFGSEGKNVTC